MENPTERPKQTIFESRNQTILEKDSSQGNQKPENSRTQALVALFLFISNSLFCHATALTSSASKNDRREAIEIIIIGDVPPIAPAYPPSNGDDWYSPPPEPLCPPPPPPPPPPVEPPCPPPMPPPPPPSPPPSPPPPRPPPPKVLPRPHPKHSPPPPPIPGYLTAELREVIKVIQKFEKTITSDPFGVTRTWSLDLDDVLFLNNNGFSGENPETFGRTAALFITLANNRFTGQIPKSIGNACRNLLEVLFLNNQISGCLPYEIGLLKLATVFDASVNKLTGPIPHSFGCLRDMELLNLSYNHLYGPVPESLCKLGCKLGHLEKHTLKFNYFTQVGPECRKLIKEKVLDISMNCILDLENQRKPEECEALFLQPRKCPDMESLSKVPCNIDDFSSGRRAHRHLCARARSTTYAAINKPHL
ncbi:PREDICTED: leucine-rich repeat extensin-like protein 3 [Nicotiana attenuata]|uniref:leucine-rich repeat extensin-like protein 3 n=1 Tax=Nicotiana attenuata TaxID=49451 RepID=UPI000904F201|nr:PREDICTED: leucine-rich repeat extensin-like protein 3 [Nicotiana attenuata]